MRLLNNTVQRQKWLNKHLFLNHDALSETWCQLCALTSETRSQSVVIAIKKSVQNPCEECNVVFKGIWAWHVRIRAVQDMFRIKKVLVLFLLGINGYIYRVTVNAKKAFDPNGLTALYALSRRVMNGWPSAKSTNSERLKWQLY